MESKTAEQEEAAAREARRIRRNKMITAIAIVLSLGLTYVSFFAWNTSQAKAWAAALWAVGPPSWFWIEYAFMTTEAEKSSKDFRDRLKFAQDSASKIWLAFGGLFTASYFESLLSK